MIQDNHSAAAASVSRPFDYHLFGTHVCFGDGVSSLILKELTALGCSRPAILAQDRMARSDQYRTLSRSWAGLDFLELPGVPTHSSVEFVETMTRKTADFGADCLVAVGGGSVADSAKALALLLAEGGQLADHVTTFVPPATVHIPRRVRPQLPIIGIPTTASGAETTSSFGVRGEDGHKLMFWNRRVAAATLLIDPLLSADLPISMMRDTAMNGIAHALEGLYSKGRSPVSDCVAIQALGMFQEALGRDAPAEADQRRGILQAAHLAGLALSMARSCLHHAICHVVASRQRLSHGAVNSVILPHALAFNEPAATDALRPALDAVNRQSPEPYPALSSWVAALQRRHSMPARLSDLGVPRDELEPMARAVMTERGLALNPRPLTSAAEVLAILRAAF
ncbi:iron-containing alcohol dehydrogenase family protein [Achromobacter sp. NPDC058515]|uniref:iron-containing alcohol dehydrogenase family protein n=1 Tax=Achromobacter sp. NPDC058515 TaxID=3346533 RepID=UPI00364D5C97